jgi:hypothetical protein
MDDTAPPDDARPERERRNDRRSGDAPAWRPNDEVPANRREDPQRRDQDNEQEQQERRAS